MFTLSRLPQRGIFVFGSNEAGRHGAGAAKYAYEKYGACMGQAMGLQGRSFGIPTRDTNLNTLPLHKIDGYIAGFTMAVSIHSDSLDFYITRIGCGLAGYKDEEIAPLFQFTTSGKGVIFPIQWKPYLNEKFHYYDGEL
jgi:hypothetical protein